jgi:hypothetical protein
MSTWNIGVFECLSSPNLSPTCFIAHCCCQPCVWSSALQQIEVENAPLLGLFVCCGGRGVLDEFAGYLGRRAVLQKYNISERDLDTGCIACFLGPCGRVQEVETIVQREGLTYGLLSVSKPIPTTRLTTSTHRSAPIQATMARTASPRSSRV